METESEMVLLIEDNDDHAELITRNFKDQNIPNPIYRVQDGIEALSVLNKTGKYVNTSIPKAILLDINLPKMNGYEFLRNIKKKDHLKNIPVVILSTSDAPKDQLMAKELGAVDYLTKSFNFSEIGKIADLLRARK